MSTSTPNAANARLLGLVRETVLAPLQDAFADVVDGLREPMLERADQLGLGRGPFLEGLFALRQQREAMLNGYRAHLVRAWQALESGAPPSAQLAFDAEASLGLVQHEELEVQLATHHLAEALSREWKSELLSLNSYLGWVDPSLRMDADSNPFSPAQISMAVYHGFAATDLQARVQAVAIQCCERDLVELVGPVYESVHHCLMREFGVQDKLSARTRQSLQIPSSEEDSAEQEPDWLTRFFIQWGGDGHDPQAMQTAKPDQAASSLPAALHQLLEESRAVRERVPGQGVAAVGTRNVLSQRELISILTLLQIASDDVLAHLVDPKGNLLERLKRHMFALAAQLGVESGAVKLAEADENIVDLIGMLFQVMFEECDLSRGQREVLGKLIAPLTKVALQDRQLFLQTTHPARRLLNILAEACEGNHGETPQEKALLEKVESTVNRLVADFDESQSVFRALRADFNTYYGEYRTAAELAAGEAAERQRTEEALEKACQRARVTLEARLEGRGLPLPVKYLLRADWVAYAAKLEVAGRPQAPLALMDGLLQSLDSARKGDPANQSAWQAVADWLQPVWMSSGKDRAQIEQMRATLLDALRHLGPAPAGGVPEPVEEGVAEEAPAPSVIGPLTPEELQEAVDFDNVTAEYFSKLALGTWLDFIDKDNRAQAGKLSWISPISGRLMFVSRTGARICVASVEELAIMVQLKRLRLHRADDAFYSAMQGVIDRLEPATPEAA